MMIKDIDDREIRYICGRLGIQCTGTNLSQMREYLECMRVFIERNAVHNDAWKEYGAEDSAGHCRSKALRVKHHADKMAGWDGIPAELKAEALDDGRDLVNYGVFFVRNVLAGRYGD
jgi:hypothetical protein